MNWVDYGILALYLLTMILMGGWFARDQKSLREFLLGGNKIPWWAAAFSGIATIASAVSFLGAPGQAFKSDLTYLQLRLALPGVIVIICALFIPVFYKLDVYTAYEYLERRFDLKTRLFASILFILIRTFFIGIKIFAPALIMSEMTGFPVPWILLLLGVLTTFYTLLGGIKAVIWTDSVQMAVFLGGLVLAAFTVVGRVDGGVARIISVAGAEGKLRFFDWSTSLTTEFTAWGCLIGGTFFMLSQYAVDQTELQRFLTTSSVKNGQRAVIATLLVASLYGILLFFVGSALYVFYLQQPAKGPVTAIVPDRAFAKFIIEELPTGLRGLVIAGVFAAGMSAVSAGLNSLATVSIRDLYQTLSGKPGSVTMARWLTLGFGALGTLISFYSGSLGNLLVASGKISNYFGGSLCGVFLMGMLVPRVNANGAFYGGIVGFIGVVALSYFTSVSWIWYSFFAAALAFLVGITISIVSAKPAANQLDGLTWVRRRSAIQQEESAHV